MKLRGILGGVALPALAFAMAVPAMAQSVSSSIRGTVVDAEGFSVPGASITIRNTATGQTSTTTSSDGGYFTATGLQVGGPYTVNVAANGYTPTEVKDVYLTLGEALRLEVSMTATAERPPAKKSSSSACAIPIPLSTSAAWVHSLTRMTSPPPRR